MISPAVNMYMESSPPIIDGTAHWSKIRWSLSGGCIVKGKVSANTSLTGSGILTVVSTLADAFEEDRDGS